MSQLAPSSRRTVRAVPTNAMAAPIVIIRLTAFDVFQMAPYSSRNVPSKMMMATLTPTMVESASPAASGGINPRPSGPMATPVRMRNSTLGTRYFAASNCAPTPRPTMAATRATTSRLT